MYSIPMSPASFSFTAMRPVCVCVCVCVGFGVYKERRTYTQTQECGRLLSASLRTTAQASTNTFFQNI